MNIFSWILQILLALHTLMGAVWKFSQSAEQTMPSLKAIPPGVWLSMAVLEMLCGVCLILPVFNRRLASLSPVAAAAIGAEMLLFSGLHLSSGDPTRGPVVYWLIVAAICAFVAYSRTLQHRSKVVAV
jgi:hypothetical protein